MVCRVMCQNFTMKISHYCFSSFILLRGCSFASVTCVNKASNTLIGWQSCIDWFIYIKEGHRLTLTSMTYDHYRLWSYDIMVAYRSCAYLFIIPSWPDGVGKGVMFPGCPSTEFIRSFVPTDLITTIRCERLEQSGWNAPGTFTSPFWWPD